MAKGFGVDGDRVEMREGGRRDVEGVDGRLVSRHFALTPETQQLALFWSLRQGEDGRSRDGVQRRKHPKRFISNQRG